MNIAIKKIHLLLTAVMILILASSSMIGAERYDSNGQQGQQLQRLDSGRFTGNRINDDLENNGMVVSHRASGHSGMEWPAGTGVYSNYASGIWFAGIVDESIRTAVGEYGPEFVPGPMGSNFNAGEHQLYIVNKSDLADPLSSSDFQNWPAHLGAPWVDVDGDGIYSPLPNGPDHPEFIGDQVIWYVMNDGDVATHSNIFGTQPLGIEVRMTIWGYNRPDAFGDMMFLKVQAFNKGGNDITDMFIGLWDDPDLGDAGDDFVGCDTTLSLGYCYNDGADSDYGPAAPALGYDFFQAAVPGEATDETFAFGELKTGYQNLPMSSFIKYINGDLVYLDPNDAQEAYNYMSGKLRDGTDIVNSATGLASKFIHPCDPNNNTGGSDDCWVDSDDHASGDRRFLMNVGPFDFASGDSLELVFGMMHAQAADPLGSITLLKQVDELAQLAYDINFALPPSPPQPNVTVQSTFEEIILSWDDIAEDYVAEDQLDLTQVPVHYDTTYTTIISDTITSWEDTLIIGTDTTFTTMYDTTFAYSQIIDEVTITYEGEPSFFHFEGYNVWQHENASGTGDRKLLATYDLINGITEIYDPSVFDPNWGVNVNVPVQHGSDSGIRRWISITADKLNGGTALLNDRAYYYTVTSYGYNEIGIPRTLESPNNIFMVRPQSDVYFDPEVETGYSDFESTHTSGSADGFISVEVVNPFDVTGDDYEVFFDNKSDTTISGTDTTIATYIVWGVNNTSNGTTPVTNQSVQTGVDASDGSEVGTYSSPVFDGIQVTVNGPPNEFKDFYVTENANGPISGWAGAAAEYNGYPGMGRDNIDNQQSNGSTWFITSSNSDNKNYEDFFPYVTRYSGGYTNPAGGMQYLVPDDFEFRFTATGSKMLNRDSGLVVDTPLEIWNVGDLADPSDDFQLMAIFNDSDGNGEWNLATDDHAISGGSNDPYLDGFYALEHMDRLPGSAGYDAMVAALTADPNASGAYIWASGPGLSLSVPGQITRVVLLNMTIANWNGGDVGDASFPANVDAVMPEIGTVFRMTTTKPNTTADTFAFSTSDAVASSMSFDCDDINVWPNPYYAFNPEERTPVDYQMHFTYLPDNATIRIYNMAGHMVKKIDHMGAQQEVWDLTNNFNLPVASGMYIAVIEGPSCKQILKLAVVMPEQRIDVY